MTSRREQQVEAWLESERESHARQRLEAQARAEAFAECEKSLGHVFTVGSDVCANCLCRVPQDDGLPF